MASLLWFVVNIQSDKNAPTLDENKATSRRTFQKKIKVLTLSCTDISGAPNLETKPLKQEKNLVLKKTMTKKLTYSLDVDLARKLAIRHKGKDTCDRLYSSNEQSA